MTARRLEVAPCRFEATERQAWDDYVTGCPTASHCHLSGWQRVIERSYGHRAAYLWAHQDGEIRGIVPLVLVRSMLTGRSVVSLPFLDDGGICAEDAESEAALGEGARRVFHDWNADFLDLRQRKPVRLALSPHGAKVTMILELADTPEAMWKRLDAKVRNHIRKAAKSGLTVSWSGIEGLDGFYRVFARNMRDLGSPVHARHFFRAILEEFPESARLVLVRKADEIIGGGLCLRFRDVLAIPWASSLRQYASLCPNNMLYWEAVRWACEKGLRRFDFGRSSPGSGTYRFKKQWGTVEEPLHWRCLARDPNRTPMLDSADSKYRLVVRLWTRLPLWLSNRGGPILRRWLTN